MLVSGSRRYVKEARYLSNMAKDDDIYSIHNEAGYNYKMLNIQAAFGVSQMDDIESFISVKEKNYNTYKTLLDGVSGIALMPFNKSTRPNYWYYSLYVDSTKYGEDRDSLMKRLVSKGVNCRPVWKPVNMQKPYLSAFSFDVVKAVEYELNILNIPCSVNLSSEQIEYVCDIIKQNNI